jgi:hypothetical protein
VLAASRAFTLAEAFWQLVFGVFADVVAVALALVAGLAEVGVAPAEPLGDGAAELAFELDEVFSVLGAVVNGDLTAIGADELLGVERSSSLRLVHGSHAIFPSSKIRFLAFEALEVCIYRRGVFFGFPEVRRVLILQFLIIFLQLFELEPLHRHFLYVLSEYPELLGHFEELAVGGDADPLLAEGAEAEVEEDTRGEPFYLESLLQAFHVEDVAAFAHYAGGGGEGFDVADGAVFVCVDVFEGDFVGLCAFLAETG